MVVGSIATLSVSLRIPTTNAQKHTHMLIREILWKVHALFCVMNVVGAEGRAQAVCMRSETCVCATL